jgi:hypothetical protein
MPRAVHTQRDTPVSEVPGRAWLLALALSALAAAACSSGDTRAPAIAAGPSSPDAGSDSDGGNSACSKAATEGCPCADVGQTAFCGWIFFHSGNYKACTHGTATCGSDLVWGKCVGSGAPVYASQK